MPTLKEIVRGASEIIHAKKSIDNLLYPIWNEVEWRISHNGENPEGVCVGVSNKPIIHLFPSLIENPDAGRNVLKAFGDLIYRRGLEMAETLWSQKLTTPTTEQVQQFAQKLADPVLRKKCKTYEQVIQSYPDKGNSVDRLVAIHLANALIANNIPYPDSVGVDIYTWGPTAEFANRKRYYSLVPLVSAYSPKDIFENFGAAFASFLIEDLDRIQDLSVAEQMKKIVYAVVAQATE